MPAEAESRRIRAKKSASKAAWIAAWASLVGLLIGLIAYGISLLAGGEILPVILGFAVVAGFLMLSYRNKLQAAGTAGMTSEMSALTTYVAAALVYARCCSWLRCPLCSTVH